MRRLIKGILMLLFVVSFMACSDKQGKQISAVIPIAENKPDSALSILNKIDQAKLSDKDLALYSLVYTMAQDKSGLDVDNDSLLRNAYNWYKDKPTDTLYAKCEYYMGKYYSLNDSSEKALVCFSNCIRTAKKQNDFYTQSMALFESSHIIREYNPDLAIHYAKDVIIKYNNVKNGPIINKVYGLLNLAECYSYKDGGIAQSISITKQAIRIARKENDTLAISNSYQDLSAFYGVMGLKDSSLYAAKLAFKYKDSLDASAVLSLAWAFVDVDSLQESISLIKRIPRQEYPRYGSVIFSLLQSIALKKRDFVGVSAYKDSLVYALESEIASNSKAKNIYYNNLIVKERLRTKVQNESQMKNGIIIVIIAFSIIVIAFVLYLSSYRRKQIQIQNAEQQEHKRLLIEHQKIQISTMRNFLMSKINILHKLESIKAGSRRQVLLSDSDWDELEVFLDSSDDVFVERLKREFPNLTKKDIRFLMLIRIRLPFPVIAQIYSIEPKSVRQKLFLMKDKLGLKNSQISAKKFIESY